jgi:hypothetical protein
MVGKRGNAAGQAGSPCATRRRGKETAGGPIGLHLPLVVSVTPKIGAVPKLTPFKDR